MTTSPSARLAAQALLAADLPEEADAPLQAAALAHTQACALAIRTEEPTTLPAHVTLASAPALLKAIPAT